MKIQKKGQLRKVVHDGCFEKIAILPDGSWNIVPWSWEGESAFMMWSDQIDDATYREIDEWLKEIEEDL